MWPQTYKEDGAWESSGGHQEEEQPLTATAPFTFSAGEKPKVAWEAGSPLLAAGEDPGHPLFSSPRAPAGPQA